MQMDNLIVVGHAQNLLKHLYTLRSEKGFCDATIIVGSETFTAHCVILSACSEYFKVMFGGGFSESFSKQVELHGIESYVFSSLLEFIYTGEIDITFENAPDMLLAADMLRIPEIIQLCCNILQSELQPSSCLGIHKLASAHSCVELRAACEVYTHIHFFEVVEHEEFNELECNELLAFLSSENLRIENELQVFKAVLKWILHDATKREECLVQILEPVRFPIISGEELFDCIEKQCNDPSIKVALGALLANYNPETKSKLKKSSNLPPDLKMKPRSCDRKYLYVIGGSYCEPGGQYQILDSVDRFDLFNQVWTSMPNLIKNRCNHTVETLDGIIYAIGGNSFDDEGLNSVESFNPLQGTWILKESMAMTTPFRQHGSCAFFNGSIIFVFGGYTRGDTISDAIEYYSPPSQRWMSAGRMRSPRVDFGVVQNEDLIYLFGGSALGTSLKTAESYDPITTEIRGLEDMGSPRSSCCAVRIEDNIYVVGGINEEFSILNSVERYSISNDEWTTIPCMSTPRCHAAAATANGLLYVVGGCSTDVAHLDTVDCYDPRANIWTNPEKMSLPRSEFAIAVL